MQACSSGLRRVALFMKWKQILFTIKKQTEHTLQASFQATGKWLFETQKTHLGGGGGGGGAYHFLKDEQL